MSVPKSVVRFDRNGVKYISSVDKAQYLIQELTRAALRDVGKFVSRTCNEAATNLSGMQKKKNKGPPRVWGKTSAFQYWVRKRECDLQVGIKHGTWYGVAQELGGTVPGGKGSGKKGVPGSKGHYGAPRRIRKHGILRNAVYNNISKIVEIESQYLSGLESEARALSMIDSEDDYQGGADD